ncbi:hypothetical protein V6N12_002043 [Hibiscus sabdariffa]|uniref:Uncharacterized protein n=1 Tax=Hibiscus sabdariffa TaxID=183260 RepID=A0ABR2B668_9ROSI
MPFWLSLDVLSNGIYWTIYALFQFDHLRPGPTDSPVEATEDTAQINSLVAHGVLIVADQWHVRFNEDCFPFARSTPTASVHKDFQSPNFPLSTTTHDAPVVVPAIIPCPQAGAHVSQTITLTVAVYEDHNVPTPSNTPVIYVPFTPHVESVSPNTIVVVPDAPHFIPCCRSVFP